MLVWVVIFLLQRIFQTWGINPGILFLLHCRRAPYPLSHSLKAIYSLLRPAYLVFLLPVPSTFSQKSIKIIDPFFLFYMASLIAQLVKNPPAMQETPVQVLGQENPLEKG